MYTKGDAHVRVHNAWFESLEPSEVTLEYLEALHTMLSNWMIAIELAIKHAKRADVPAKVADKKISP